MDRIVQPVGPTEIGCDRSFTMTYWSPFLGQPCLEEEIAVVHNGYHMNTKPKHSPQSVWDLDEYSKPGSNGPAVSWMKFNARRVDRDRRLAGHRDLLVDLLGDRRQGVCLAVVVLRGRPV